jgi:hypothetical protein
MKIILWFFGVDIQSLITAIIQAFSIRRQYSSYFLRQLKFFDFFSTPFTLYVLTFHQPPDHIGALTLTFLQPVFKK